MAQTYTSRIAAPLDDVYGWHEQPGALKRLMPPWMRPHVRQEAESLRDGTSVVSLYRLLTWRAQHLPEAFDPPRTFADELVAGFGRTPLRWHHTHQFDNVDDAESRVTDRLVTNVPVRALRPVFEYRHRQLADEMAALYRSREWDSGTRSVGLTGASGLVGSALSALLTSSGHRVVHLVRREPRSADERRWDPDNPAPGLLDGLDGLVHLAGAPIFGRFTAGHKARVRDSRVEPTRALAQRAVQSGLTVFVSAAGVGNYPDAGKGEFAVESDGPGQGFLADVVNEWEAATAPAAEAGLRTVQVRTGIAMSPEGGVLGMLAPAFKLGAGGRLGHGRQYMGWIMLDDLVDVYRRAVLDATLAGPVNAVAPSPVSNAEFTRVLGRVVKRPTVMHVPRMAPAAVLGSDGADEFALANQQVVPQKLIDAGHVFRYPDLEAGLRHVLGRGQ